VKNADLGAGPPLDGSALRIGIVQARFNEGITNSLAQACIGELERLASSCVAELHACGVAAERVRHVTVPGALEVPIALLALADSGRYDALVALGCVIRGETYHFELVADESAAGVTRVALDKRIPIANAILTVENEAQAWARAEDKGRDAARAAVEMAQLMERLR